ncbi:MAG TPA: hypothetical protein H9733_01710 [Candidatus Anaerotignum merdipullorum]|nr:hypothetical protein [Candidatus Anaerotignum merdipullorum]
MKIFHRRKTAIFFALIIGLIIVYLLLSHNSNSKSAIINYVQNNKSELETYVQDISADEKTYTDIYNNWNVSYYQNSGVVEFLVSTGGLGSSSKYYGFYYSPQNIPMGYQEQNVKLLENETGWQWSDPNGDNQYYTEKIADNWYWFEMDF